MIVKFYTLSAIVFTWCSTLHGMQDLPEEVDDPIGKGQLNELQALTPAIFMIADDITKNVINPQIRTLHPDCTGHEFIWSEKNIQYDMVGKFPSARFWAMTPTQISWLHLPTFEKSPAQGDSWQILNQPIDPELYHGFVKLYQHLEQNFLVNNIEYSPDGYCEIYERNLYGNGHNSSIISGTPNKRLGVPYSGFMSHQNPILSYNMLGKTLYGTVEYGKLDVYKQIWFLVQCQELMRNKDFIPLPFPPKNNNVSSPHTPTQHLMFGMEADKLWNLLLPNSLPSPVGEVLYRNMEAIIAVQWNKHFINFARFRCTATTRLDELPIPADYVHELEKRKLKIPTLAEYHFMLLDMIGISRGSLPMDDMWACFLDYYPALPTRKPKEHFQNMEKAVFIRFPQKGQSNWEHCLLSTPIVNIIMEFEFQDAIPDYVKKDLMKVIDEYKKNNSIDIFLKQLKEEERQASKED